MNTAHRHVEHSCEWLSLLRRWESGSGVDFVEDYELSGVCVSALFLDGRLLARCWGNLRRGINSRRLTHKGRLRTTAVRQGGMAIKLRNVVKRTIRAVVLGVHWGRWLVRLLLLIGIRVDRRISGVLCWIWSHWRSIGIGTIKRIQLWEIVWRSLPSVALRGWGRR